MYKIVIYVFIILVVLPVAFFFWMTYRMNYPNIGINVKTYSRIPDAARNIYYVDAPLYGQCFFTLGKDEFKNWINDKRYSDHKVSNPDSERIVRSKIKGYPMELADCKNAELYEWRDLDGGGYSVNYFAENELVVYDWSSN